MCVTSEILNLANHITFLENRGGKKTRNFCHINSVSLFHCNREYQKGYFLKSNICALNHQGRTSSIKKIVCLLH